MQEPLFEAADLERASAGDAGLRAELLRLFDVEAERLLGRLDDAVAADDRDAARAAAHRLRGSAGIVGARRLRAACAELEAESAVAPRERLSALVAGVRSVTGDTLTALRRPADTHDV